MDMACSCESGKGGERKPGNDLGPWLLGCLGICAFLAGWRERGLGDGGG